MNRACVAFASVLLVTCGRSEPLIAPAPAAANANPAVARIDAALPRFRTPPATSEPRDPRLADAERALAAGDFGGARQILLPITADHPQANWPRFLLALTHHEEKRYAEARPLLEAVLDGACTHPGLAQAFYFYGWCLQNLGELDGARAAFVAAVELESGNADARFGLGLVEHERQEHEAAQRDLLAALELFERVDPARDPSATADVAKAHALLGDVAFALDQVGEARRHLELCVQLEPRHHEAWFRLARVLQHAGDADGAARARATGDEWRRRLGR